MKVKGVTISQAAISEAEAAIRESCPITRISGASFQRIESIMRRHHRGASEAASCDADEVAMRAADRFLQGARKDGRISYNRKTRRWEPSA